LKKVHTAVEEFNVCWISPSWQEEADGRIVLHVKHEADNGHKYINIRTVDSDVLVISVSGEYSDGKNLIIVIYQCGQPFLRPQKFMKNSIHVPLCASV